MSDRVIQLPFKHSRGYDIGVEIFTLDELYARQGELTHHIAEPHRLDFYVLLYITEGMGLHTVDFNAFHAGPQTLAIISKHQIQQFAPHFPLQGYIIMLTEAFLQRSLFDLERGVTHVLFEPITTQALFLHNAGSIYPHIQRLLEEYGTSAFDEQHAPILSREIGILLLKAERLRRLQLPKEDQQAEASLRLIAFRDLLETHYKAHWTAQQYADELAFSRKTLGALTKKYLHRSPKEVIDQRLMLEIKRLLAHTDQSIKEIAYQLGFEDPSNVNKFFRRMSGVTPTAFRQNL